MSLAAGAGTSLALALAPSPFAFYDAFDWLMGSFVDRSLKQAAAALIPAAVAGALILRRAAALDLLALGEDVVASVGLKPRRSAIEVVVLSRNRGRRMRRGLRRDRLRRTDRTGLRPAAERAATRAGRCFRQRRSARCWCCSPTLCRAPLLLGRAIPVGVITTLAGTPLFIAVLLSMRRRLTS